MVEPASLPEARQSLHVVLLCTGNAARSVMAGAVLSARGSGLRITTAGTHVIEGQPMSTRTRAALIELGLSAPGHRSHQLSVEDVESADLIVGMACEHVTYVRREHPGAAARAGTLRRLTRDLPPTPGPLADRVAALDLGGVALEGWEDVEDPAGGELEAFLSCASEISVLVSQLAPALG